MGALGLTRLLSTLLFGIPPADPASFVGAIVVVLIVAGLASYLPARKVVAASPMLALQVAGGHRWSVTSSQTQIRAAVAPPASAGGVARATAAAAACLAAQPGR